MRRFLLVRAARLSFVLLAVTMLTFSLVNALPGDPAVALLGEHGATEEAVAAVRERLNLDAPLPAQYGAWLGNALRGDLGRSFRNGQEVTSAIAQRLPVTVELIFLSQLIALTVAIPLAIVAAYRRDGAFDGISGTLMFAVLSVPHFVLGIILIYIFAIRLNWLPSIGYVPITNGIVAHLRSVILPALALSGLAMALYQRLLRTDMIATLQEEFIAVARAKGVSTSAILIRHALRPSMVSLLTIAGIVIGSLIGGAVVVETLFGLPGIGRLLVDSIVGRDYLMVQGIILIIALSYVIINFAVDVVYGLLDPRIRIGQ